MPTRLMVIVCAVLPLACWAARLQERSASGQQKDASSAGQDFVALQKAFIAAQERGDAEYVKNAVAEDFSAIEASGNTTDRADFIKVERPEKPEPSPILYDFRVVEVDEECAIVTYNAVFPGNRLERYQHVSDTWVNDDGHWKLKFQQSTINLWSAHDLD